MRGEKICNFGNFLANFRVFLGRKSPNIILAMWNLARRRTFGPLRRAKFHVNRELCRPCGTKTAKFTWVILILAVARPVKTRLSPVTTFDLYYINVHLLQRPAADFWIMQCQITTHMLTSNGNITIGNIIAHGKQCKMLTITFQNWKKHFHHKLLTHKQLSRS